MAHLEEKTATFTATEADAGLRLDAFVARALSCGLREAKRRIADGQVAANGKARPAQYKLLPGAEIRILPGKAAPPSPLEEAVSLLALSERFAVFYKPPGLHTAAVAASGTPSLERAVSANWTAWREAHLAGKRPEPPELAPVIIRATGGELREYAARLSSPPQEPPLLVNRLDAATSGLVTAAFGPENAAKFREYEAAGAVDKYYLAVIRGLPPGPLELRAALDTDSRVKTRVRDRDAVDATRYTEVFPLGLAAGFLEDAPDGTALAAVRIKRGARHQIRAHLAHAGYPLYADALYGDAAEVSFRLHHTRLSMPGFDIYFPPPWPMGHL